ncbi:MAG: type VI secretion system-associated protein TagF, partial [Methylococcaceae bacterium]|nr:type VI secretion system-associated protein TagF [Methylococcaceae bacterium]
MASLIESTPVGFYGKLPIIGDFVSRRLPEEFITPWDSWLQSAIAASREALGEEWLSRFLTSPIWRFLLSPGVCGERAVAGIVMPSVDRVGRYFPLTVAVVFEQSPPLPLVLATGNAWFEQLEDVALTGLEGNLDLQAFDQLIQGIPVFSMSVHSSPAPQSFTEKKAFYIAMEHCGQTADAFVELNAQLLINFMPGYSLWRNAGSEHVGSALLAYEGLPPIGEFAEFLYAKKKLKHRLTAPRPLYQLSASNFNAIMASVNSPQLPELENPILMRGIAGENDTLIEPLWRSWAITDTGKRRKVNEDALLNKPEMGLWVVADGMGGHKAGDVASQLIVNTLNDLLPTEPIENYVGVVEQSLQKVNTQLRQLAAQ